MTLQELKAMNLALEALMYASYEDIEYNDACAAKVLEARNALKEALAQPEQEPVEYQYRTRPDWIPEWNRWNTCSKDSADAYEKNPYLHDWHYEVRTLYAAPSQREWVGLTVEAHEECEEWLGHDVSSQVFYVIEAKLKEKNT